MSSGTQIGALIFMIQKLKNSRLGKSLYRLSRQPGGSSLRKAAQVMQSEKMNTTHMMPANKAHNKRQQDVLQAFEQQTGTLK